MSKIKPNSCKVPGFIVHNKCTNLEPKANKCRRFFGSGFKTRYINGIVQSVRVNKLEAGWNQTFLTIKFVVAGFKEITK